MSSREALLVVHDDATQLRLACALLERQRYEVYPASSAAEALRLLEDRDFIAGVVTDLHLPEIDGWRFCRLLRSPTYRRFNDIPILVVSAAFGANDASPLLADLGANDFLPSPYPPGALCRRVARMLAGDSPAASLPVLLVQEYSQQSTALAETFAAHGYDVYVGRNGRDARRFFRDYAPGIVVVEDELEDATALDLLREFKRPGSPAVVVVTTKAHQPDVAVTLLRKGADGYVRELYDPAYVLMVCERARRRRALRHVEERLADRTSGLREAELRLRAVLRGLPEIVLVYDRDGTILELNRAASGLLESEDRKLVGHDLRDVVAPECVDGLAAQLARTRAGGSHTYDIVYCTPDDGRLEVEVTETMIRTEDRDAILAVARDIGGRRRAEEERTLLAAAVQQAGEMIVITGADGKIRYVNPAFEGITGYTREEAIGSSVRILRGEGEDEKVWKEMLERTTGGRSWRGQMRRRRRDGRVYVSRGTISPVRDDSGNIVNYVGVEQDISQEEELERALHQAQKMEAIGTLAGGVAHDFNNLLTGILGYANLIYRVAPAGSELKEMAEIIETSADRAAQLTKQLLGFARRGKHRNLPIDLNETVERVVRLLARTIGKRIRLVTHLEAKPAGILGDPTQIDQALLNLAINARDAIEDKEGEIVIDTRRFVMDEIYAARHPGATPGDYVLVTVTDDGCGMTPEIQSRIFEPFFTTKSRDKGTGMGLSMVYGIVKNHGGGIYVYSEAGHGTSFRVFLPLSAEAAAEEANPIGADPIRGTGRILIVDDEEVVRNTASTMLRHLGYEVVAMADGADAVLYYQHFGESVNLVLLDMVMPKMSGHDCFLALKELDPDIKVVLSTGFGLNEAAQAILDAGALGFAQKPYRVTELSEVVATVMRGEAYLAPPSEVVAE
ncbi:MAG: response regulator [Planctomycetota bacterium]